MKGWTLTASSFNRQEVFEIWLYRRVLTRPCTPRTTNEVVLRRMYLRHMMRIAKYRFLELMIKGKIKTNEEWKGREFRGLNFLVS